MMSPDHVEVKTQSLENAVVFRPLGDIDLSRAPSLRLQLGEVQRSGTRRVIVDLEDVPYMDSSGVATLVEAMQTARREKTDLVLCGLQDKVRSVFQIARLDMVFTIVDTVDEAVTV
jgi:anti-sigma B factor antagonist